MMANYDFDQAPKDRRILIKTPRSGYDMKLGKHVRKGTAWVEAWWGYRFGNEQMGVSKSWVVWCGDEKTQTTDTLEPICWAELPEDGGA